MTDSSFFTRFGHVFITGRNGCGKTKLAKIYLSGIANVVVLDIKGTFKWDEAGDVPIVTTFAELIKFGEGKVIYQPIHEEMIPEFYDRFFEWIYNRRNTTIFLDEAMGIKNGRTIYLPAYAHAILTRGRERNTWIWACTQRPKTIPIEYMSEASRFFIFRLNMEGDRKRVMEVLPYKEMNQIIENYQFFYMDDTMDKPELGKLDLK